MKNRKHRDHHISTGSSCPIGLPEILSNTRKKSESSTNRFALPFSKSPITISRVKFTRYFHSMRERPDRAMIRLEWIQYVMDNPVRETIQEDGRIRRWA